MTLQAAAGQGQALPWAGSRLAGQQEGTVSFRAGGLGSQGARDWVVGNRNTCT